MLSVDNQPFPNHGRPIFVFTEKNTKLAKTAFTMRFRKNKFYREGAFHHLYIKAKNGNVIFYRIEDYLFIYTLASVLSRRHKVIVELFCVMFNHLHGCVKARTQSVFRAFLRDLSSLFTVGYNEEYHLTGSLLLPCGYAPKVSAKTHKTCLIYIANNPSTGRLVKSVLDYKWGLVPYFFSDHPFSEKLVKRNARFAMRQALSIVDGCKRRGQHLNYPILRKIFKKLNSREKAQIVDYIIIKYFFLDKQSFFSHFESEEKALVAMDSSAGSEHDLYEPWEDYSVYLEMIRATLSSGLDYKMFRFHQMPADQLIILRNKLSGLPGVTKIHIERFLHLNEP